MNRHSILPTLVLALAFSVQPLNAAKKKAPPAKAPNEESTPSFLDKKVQGREKRAYHLAEKSATMDFRNSPDGIAFKKRMASTDDEINAVYEKNLNVFREGPENGKKLSEEMERQVQLLKQKRDEIEAEFEKLRKTSPVYRAMYEKHLKSELGQVKGKLKSKPSEEPEESEDNQ